MNRKRLKITLLAGLIAFILLISSFQSILLSQIPDPLKIKYKNALKLTGEQEYDKAISEMQQIVQEYPDFSNVYRNLVEAYIFINELDSAQDYFENLLKKNSQNAYVYYALARIDIDRGAFDDAMAKLKKSIALDPKFTDAFGYRSGLPEVYRAKKDLDSAIQFFNELIQVQPKNACAYYGLARSFIRKYEWEQALKALTQAVELDPELTLAYHSMVFIYFSTTKYDKVREMSHKLLQVSEKYGEFELMAYATMMIGNAYFLQGDYLNALQNFNEALKLAQEIGAKRREGTCLQNLASLYAMSGNFPKALKYFNEALLLARKTGTIIWEVQALENIGNVYKDQGDFQQALKYYRETLESSQKNKFKYEESIVLSNMAEIYQNRGDFKQALKYQNEALKIAIEIEEKAQQGYILRNLGILNQDIGNDSEAIKSLHQALNIGIETQDIQIIWETQAGLGLCYEKQGNMLEAITHYSNAIAIYDSVRNNLDIESLRNNFLEDKYEAYPSIIQLLAHYGKLKEAFTYAEKYKAKTILDIISQGRDLFSELLSDTLQAQLQQITSQHEAVHKELSSELSKTKKDENKVLSLDQQITDLELKKAAILEDLKTKNRDYYQLTSPDIMKIDEIQQQILSGEQALVEYIIGPQTISIFTVTSDTLIYTSVAVSRERLRAMLAELSPIFQIQKSAGEKNRQQIFNPQMADFSISPAYALYNALLKPVEPLLQDAKELIIVPDDILFYLPFEMLVFDTTGIETRYDFDNAKFLIEKFDVSYSSSASLLDPDLQRPGNPQKGILAVGNPDFNLPADEPEYEELLTSKEPHFSDTVRGDQLLSLPNSETEVKAIGSVLSGARNSIFIGKQATEENFKNEAEKFTILHLATHFLTDDEQPLYSKIVLAQKNKANEDGYLQTYEVFNMNLNADLVVLSACNTGLGNIRKGEGVIGISRAFQFAGVPSLVVSLWNVNDESTAIIMINFYQHLKAGLNKKQALRHAKIDYLKSSQIYGKDPFYWAPFILIGDWSPVHFPSHSALHMWIIAIVMMLMVIVATFIIRKRRLYSRP